MLETGSVTSKNTEAIMLKNLGDLALTVLGWWSVGYSFAFEGGNSFIGILPGHGFFTNGIASAYDWAYFFFQLNFAATASTIVSGAIAERAHIMSYFLFSFI